MGGGNSWHVGGRRRPQGHTTLTIFPAPEERTMHKSSQRMLLPSSRTAAQTAAVGSSLCRALYNTLRRSRPEKHAYQGRAEAKAAPGKCFKAETALMASILLSSMMGMSCRPAQFQHPVKGRESWHKKSSLFPSNRNSETQFVLLPEKTIATPSSESDFM